MIEEIEHEENTMNKLLLEMVKNQKENISKLVKLFIVVIICYTIVLISGIVCFFVYESQFEKEYDPYTETTITQEVSGNDSEINNVSGDMYKDNSVHNE